MDENAPAFNLEARQFVSVFVSYSFNLFSFSFILFFSFNFFVTVSCSLFLLTLTGIWHLLSSSFIRSFSDACLYIHVSPLRNPGLLFHVSVCLLPLFLFFVFCFTFVLPFPIHVLFPC